jgi:hypothetical protein
LRSVTANIVVSALLLVSLRATAWALEGQNTRAAKAPRRVVKAYCDEIGAHVVYDSGPALVRRARHDQRCADLRVDEDRRDVGWLMESEATAESDGKVIERWTRRDLFVNGIQVKYDDAALYDWRFHNRERRVVFEAGPLHGGGNMFLYDIAKRQVVDRCLKRQSGVTCPAWAQ